MKNINNFLIYCYHRHSWLSKTLTESIIPSIDLEKHHFLPSGDQNLTQFLCCKPVSVSYFNPISTRRRGDLLPGGFSSITQKRDKTFFIDSWATICFIKFEDRPFRVAMAMAQIKGHQNDIVENN